MKRKLGVLVGIIAVGALAMILQGWIGDPGPKIGRVEYSPLFQQRVVDALVPVTSQVALAGDFPSAVGAVCDETRDCQETWDCQETYDNCETVECKETYDCQETMDGKTCEATCKGWATCAGAVTCIGHPTCDSETCDGEECDGPTTIDGGICLKTFAGPRCEGPTIEWDKTCDVYFCDMPTYFRGTCERPTCDGPTCEGPTCRGPTCFRFECDVWDFGDAPDGPRFAENLRTLLENDGARHVIDGVFYLGLREDAEVDGQPDIAAAGDDDPPWDPRDDEDGVWFVTTLVPGQPAVVIVRSSIESILHGWIDYDESGNWRGDSDKLFDEPWALQPGFNWIWFTVPENAATTNLTYARFRMSGPPLDHGDAIHGEVEDYRISVCQDLNAWLLTDEILYEANQPITVTFHVSDVAQATLVRHRSNGEAEVILSATVEPGRHEISAYGEMLLADEPFGAETLELVVTGLQTGCTAWLTTPYVTTDS